MRYSGHPCWGAAAAAAVSAEAAEVSPAASAAVSEAAHSVEAEPAEVGRKTPLSLLDFVERLDDLGDERMPHHVLCPEIDNGNTFYIPYQIDSAHKPGVFFVGCSPCG